MLRILLFVISLSVLGLVASQGADGDDNDEVYVASALHANNDIAWSQMTVKVLDSEGNPVEGATVRPWALGAGNGHGRWDDDNYGSPVRTTTSATGETNVVFPQKATWGHDTDPVVQVSMIVTHSEFCAKNAHVNVVTDVQDIPEIALERGVRIRVAGVAPGSDQPLSDCHLLFENVDTGGPNFSRQSDGWLQSFPVRADQRWFRIVRAVPGRPPEFSIPQAWDPDDPATREVRVEVRPGVRVRGKVSDSVTRPIKRGHVAVRCGSPAHGEAADNLPQRNPIWWMDSVPIEADGSFEFSSLPSGFLAQFYAMANDSISAQPSDEAYETCCNWFGVQNRERNDIFRYGQILRLAGKKADLTIEMESAGQVLVKCVDPEGRPLSGIDVSAWPNQFMVGGGSTIFCLGFKSLEHINNKRFDLQRENPFQAKSDSAGEALIRNLPAGQQSFYASNHLWASKEIESGNSESEKTMELKITLRRTSSED